MSERIIRTVPSTTYARLAPVRVAVVMPSVLRPTIIRAVESVFAQTVAGPSQLLIGVDQPLGDPGVIDRILRMRPPHWVVSVFDPGYSTSERHGGIHCSRDGGALRSILTYTAHSKFVAYIDDDNWWDPRHLETLLAAIDGHDWAFSLRYFVDAASSKPLCVDEWESVGPGRGVFLRRFGGWADPNTLLIDKLACPETLPLWSQPLPKDPTKCTADRSVCDFLMRHRRSRGTGLPTAYYVMGPNDVLHPMRMRAISGEARPAPGEPYPALSPVARAPVTQA